MGSGGSKMMSDDRGGWPKDGFRPVAKRAGGCRVARARSATAAAASHPESAVQPVLLLFSQDPIANESGITSAV